MPKKKEYKTEFAPVLDKGIKAYARAWEKTNGYEVALGFIEAEIAHEVGVGVRAVQSWRYKVIPPLKHLIKLAQVCVGKASKELGRDWVIELFEKADMHQYTGEAIKKIFNENFEPEPKQDRHKNSQEYTRSNVEDHLPHQGFSPPSQFPPLVENFINREMDLDQLMKAVQPEHVVTLCGPGGIGKSALASETIRRLHQEGTLLQRFPDGVVFYDFYNHPMAALALEYIARTFGEAPEPTPALAAQRILSERRALLILDSTELVDDLPGILNVRGNCGVLMTSRSRWDARADRYDLLPLAMNEAVTLLQAWGKERAADVATVSQICELVGGLPLAAKLIGLYLNVADMEAIEYLTELSKTPLEALDFRMRQLKSVPMVLKQSISQVSEEAQQIMGVIGLLALTPFEREAVSEALAMPMSKVTRALGELVNYGLLHRIENRYKVAHALIHTYVQQNHRPAVEVERRLAIYYRTVAQAQVELGVKGYTWLDSERLNLIAILTRCAEYKDWEAVLSLAWTIEYFLDIRGYWVQRVTTNEAGLMAARALGHQSDEEAFLDKLGNTYQGLGLVEQAIEYYEQALSIARKIDDRPGEGICLGNLGLAYRNLGQVKRAIQYYEQALRIAREAGNQNAENTHLNNLGLAYHDLGDISQAVLYLEQGLTIAQKINDRRGEGIFWGNLGRAYLDLRQVEQAIEAYQQALAIAIDIGDRHSESAHLGNLGLAYHDLRQIDKAIENYQRALTIAREIGYQRGEIAHLDNLGLAYHDLGDVQQAISYHEQALAIARKISDGYGEGVSLGNLGLAYRDLGQIDKAIEYTEHALTIARRISDRPRESIHSINLGLIYAALGNMEQAIHYYKQALNIVREIANQPMEETLLSSLGLTFYTLGNMEQAIYYHNQALSIARTIGNQAGASAHLGNLGLAYQNMGQVEEAIKYHEQALVISREFGDRRSEGSHLANLGAAYGQLGRTENTIAYYQQALEIAQKMGDQLSEGVRLSHLGRAYYLSGQVEKAIVYHRQALKIMRETADRRNEAEVLIDLGQFHLKLGQTEQAKLSLEKALSIFDLEGINSPQVERIRTKLRKLG